MIEDMTDGEGKIAAQKEIAAAQDAMLSGKAGVRAAHLSKAMQASAAKAWQRAGQLRPAL